MPQPRTNPAAGKPVSPDPTAEDLAAKLKAVEEERDAALADLEAATAPGASAAKPKAQEAASYVVTGAGVCYLVDGDPAHSTLALRGNVIELVDTEARRLVMLGAVRAATKEDAIRDAVVSEARMVEAAAAMAGPKDNPYGGQTVAGKTLEQHADEQIKLAKKTAKA